MNSARKLLQLLNTVVYNFKFKGPLKLFLEVRYDFTLLFMIENDIELIKAGSERWSVSFKRRFELFGLYNLLATYPFGPLV